MMKELEIGENDWNPRYISYAKAHGMTPGRMLEQDERKWPGGCMTGFIVWMSEQKQLFYKACPSGFLDRYTISDQEAWTRFLDKS